MSISFHVEISSKLVHEDPYTPSSRLYKTEVIRRLGPWRGIDAVEYATLDWVDWFNNRRLIGPIGYVPPAELEAQWYESQQGQAKVA